MAVLQTQTENPSTATSFRGIVVHALHKSASMFLYKFFGKLCSQQNWDFFSDNNDPANPLIDRGMIATNFCHCPVRTFEVDHSLDQHTDVQRIFHVRDPRDMLVSEYFSFGWIHPSANHQLDDRRNEIQKMSIDDYVIGQSEFSQWPLEQKFAPLIARELDFESDYLVKYETLVTEFPKWAAQAIRPFQFRYPKIAVAKLAWRYRSEFKPSSQPGAHKRNVTPGDFRLKLKPKTIEILNDRFSDVLQRFGYQP